MPPQQPAADGLREASWEDVVTAIAKQHKVNPRLAIAVAKKESSLNPQAVGDGGDAIGMFQLHVPAAADMGLSAEDRSDPLKNITGGIKYLKSLSDRYQGDVNKTLMAYNGGMGNVDAGTVSPAAQAYAAEVMASLSANVRQTTSAAPVAPATAPAPPAAPGNVRVTAPTPPAGAPSGNPVMDLLGGARAQLARTIYGGGDLLRRGAQAAGLPVERIVGDPGVQAAMTPPASTAGRVGQFATEVAEFALPAGLITKTAKGLQLANTLIRSGVTANRARMAAAAAEGGGQAATAAGISVLQGDDPTAAAVVSGAMPIAAQAVTAMAPAIRRSATTRLARFMERGVSGHVTPQMEQTLAQAAEDFIELPLQKTWRATARMTHAGRKTAGANLGAALDGPLGDTLVPLAPITQGLNDLVAEATHLLPAGKGQFQSHVYKKGIVDAVAQLNGELAHYAKAYDGMAPARYLHDFKSVWQKTLYPTREAAKPVASVTELLTTAQKEALQRGTTAISRVLERNAPAIADLDNAVAHAIKLDQFVKRLAGKARTSSLATSTARHAAATVGAGAGFVSGGAVGHPLLGATVGGITARMLLNALQSPRWRLTPIATRRKLADALARGDADTARALVTPLYVAATGDADNILQTLPESQQKAVR